MDTLDRYLIIEFLLYFFVILLGLVSLYLGIDFFSKFWSFTIPLNKIFELYIYKIPTSINQFIPVACLMATLLMLSNMSRQNEILALYSGGIGTLRVVSTFVAVVAIISTVSFITFDNLGPLFQKKEMLAARGESADSEHLLEFNRKRFWFRSNRIIYNVSRFDRNTNTIEGIDVYFLAPDFSLKQKIRAKQARYVDGDWILEDGFTITFEDNFPLSEKFESKAGVIPESPSDFKSLQVYEFTMKLRELRKYIDRNRSYGLDTLRSRVYYNEKIAFVFTPLIFTLLAIPFATHPLRSYSTGKGIGFCFLVIIFYLVVVRFSLSLGRAGYLHPIVAGWATNVAFLGYSIFALARKRL